MLICDVLVSNTFGVDNDTESQRVIRARMTLREDIGKLRDESTRRLDTIETDIEGIQVTLSTQGKTLDKHSTKFTSIEKTLDEHGTKLTSMEKTLDKHSAKFTSIEETLAAHGTRLASIDRTTHSQLDELQKQLSDLTFLVNVIALTLGMRLPLDKSQFPQLLDAANAATQLTHQPSRSSPPLEPIQFSRDHIRAPSDSPSPGPSTRRLPDADRVDFTINRSEVDVHQLLSEARADTGPETKHAVKGLLKNLKTVIVSSFRSALLSYICDTDCLASQRSVSSKNLKSSKSVKSFKSTI